MDEAQKEKYDVRRIILHGRKFDEGPILKTLTKLAIPIMASSFLGTLYNITDMAWIGLLGSKAVAGIGVGGMFIWLSQGFAFHGKDGRTGTGGTVRRKRR